MAHGINYHSMQLAKVKDRKDVNRTGRCRVWLMNSNTNENDESNWISIRLSSPSAGVSPPAGLDSNSTQSPGGTQTAFGMFMGPPAVENVVLVAFNNGDPSQGFFMGSTFPDGMTQGVPGRAAGNTHQGGGKQSGEVNRFQQPVEYPSSQPTRPESTQAGAFQEQDLADDPLLGPGQSSVSREDEPKLMGWVSQGGHQIVLDDGDGYSLIRLRTPSGVQLLLSETTGDIFLINKSGNGWIKVGNGGECDIYSSEGFNLFSGSTINLKSGGDINMEAGGDINVKAGGSVNNDGASINLKAGSILSSKITGEISYADTAGFAIPGSPAPVGDPAGSAGSVTRTPSRGGKAS